MIQLFKVLEMWVHRLKILEYFIFQDVNLKKFKEFRLLSSWKSYILATIRFMNFLILDF